MSDTLIAIIIVVIIFAFIGIVFPAVIMPKFFEDKHDKKKQK